MNCFACLSEIHWQCFRNCNLRVRQNNLKRALFERHVFFSLGLQTEIFRLHQFFVGWGYQNCLLRAPSITFGKIYLLKNSFLSHFQNWLEFSQKFNEFSPAGLSKLHSASPREQLEEKFCLLKKIHFSSFCDTGRKLLACFSIFFDTVVKTAFYVSLRKVWKKKHIYSKKLLCCFSDIERNFCSLLLEFRWLPCRNCILSVRTNI